MVNVAPPPARMEFVPPAPRDKGAVWVDGEWTQRRGRWAWKLGRWLIPPDGASFSPWVLVRGSADDLYFAPGVFRDPKGTVVAEPTPLAVAKADSAAVVGPDGFVIATGRTVRSTTTVKPKPGRDGSGPEPAPGASDHEPAHDALEHEPAP